MSKKYDWNKLYEEYQSLNISKCRFAKEKGIAESLVCKSFRDIESRVANKNNSDMFLPLNVVTGSVVPTDQPVAASKSAVPTIELEFHELKIHLQPGFSKKLLSEVLTAVGFTC